MSQLTKDGNAKQLTGGEILLLTKNNTMFVHGHKVDTYLYFDGSGYVYGQDIFSNKDTGIWDVSQEGELCIKMKKWWESGLRCYSAYHDGSKYYLFNSSEVLEFTAEQLEGDRKNLYYSQEKSKKMFLRAQSSEQTTPATATTMEKPDSERESPQSVIPAGEPSPEELKSTVKWMAKDCPDCNLKEADLSGAELIGARLQGANLSGANLSKANLRRADLREANLENADLSYANLPGADLRDSDLTNAVLTGANLIRADLTGAKTEGARFDNALLEGVEGLQK